MRTVVSADNLPNVLARLVKHDAFAVDTETTGLKAYKGHRLFSLIIATVDDVFYFNFQNYPEAMSLDRAKVFAVLSAEIFSRKTAIFYLHNAKFDMHMLAQEGVYLAGTIHCTYAHERLIYNKLPSYALGIVAPRHGFKKSKAVDQYITKHKLFTKHLPPGKKREVRTPHFDRVSFPVISEYGLDDGQITIGVGISQRAQLTKFYGSFGPTIRAKAMKLVANERELTKVCFEMERTGIKIDRGYCEQAFKTTFARAQEAARQYEEISGAPLVDSPKALAEVLPKIGVRAGRTAPTKTFPEGQLSYNKHALLASGHPAATALLEYRRNSKVAGTYFRNFLDLSDTEDLIHGDIRQAGTDTGRFSMSDPNLQNLKKNTDEDAAPVDAEEDDELDEETTFQVRRAFVPRDADHCLLMIDYDQQEYRMMLDEAEEMDLIRKVLNGLDVHQATADMMGVERYPAKTLNFMLLYGGGAAKLAAALKLSLDAAYMLRDKYFSTLPNVRRFIRSTQSEAEDKGRIFNWAGRVYHFQRDHCYKSPNTKIQGGGGDVMRFAMTACSRFLEGRRTKMLVTVHDELLFELHKSELGIVPELKTIMETVYPHRHLPLTCSVSHSWKSWGDKVKGAPT